MSENLIIKEQFDKGARNFDNWSVTQNEKMMRGLADFCQLSPADQMLDVACGTGAFSLFVAPMVTAVTGIDISEGMIRIARENAQQRKIGNATFDCQDVEEIRLPDGSFSVVVSKSAYHHMKNYQKVFAGMVRCCQEGGRTCIQDIMAYGDPKQDSYFEEMELLIDESHYKTYSKREFFDLYKENGVKVVGLFDSETYLDFYDYVGHTVQSTLNREKVDALLQKGLEDPEIASCFLHQEGRLLWKRKVCTIVGQKGVK